MNENKIITLSQNLVGLASVFASITSNEISVSDELKEATRDSIQEICSTIISEVYNIVPFRK